MTPADTCGAPTAGGLGRKKHGHRTSRLSPNAPLSPDGPASPQGTLSLLEVPTPQTHRGSLDTPGPWPAAAEGPAAGRHPRRVAQLLPSVLRRHQGRGGHASEAARGLGPTGAPKLVLSTRAPLSLRPLPRGREECDPNLFWMQGTPHPSLHQPRAHVPSQKSRGTGPRAGAGVPLHGNHSFPEEPGDLGPQDPLLVSFPPSRARGQADPGASTSVPLPRWGTGPAGSWHDQDGSPAPRKAGPRSETLKPQLEGPAPGAFLRLLGCQPSALLQLGDGSRPLMPKTSPWSHPAGPRTWAWAPRTRVEANRGGSLSPPHCATSPGGSLGQDQP